MSTTAPSFYVTGGTLRQDAPSYVPRQADADLYEGLLQGEYCYVLHARQMGKSSLMVHTTARLRAEGVAVAAFELTALGQNLTVEQWYDGLLSRVGRELDLEDELEEYSLVHERQSPLQRWLGAIQEVVLVRSPGRIVLFLDEIDAVRSLPFSTDEFFAAIRECYNRRTQAPEFQRLTFCLLGVATPSDLIQDMRTTPFNIGRRIELTDFTEEEAAPLAAGLIRRAPPPAPPLQGEGSPTLPSPTPPLQGEGSLPPPAVPRQGGEQVAPPSLAGKGVGGLGPAHALLQRVLHWTGGHPYLTQRLCQAVAQDETVTDPEGVDRLCEVLYLSPQAQERDDNLLFVRERLLKSEADRASLLDLYGQVRAGKRVRLDDTNQLVSLLRLSGITRVSEGSLRVRNRIYERVFDRQWVTLHMPDAELRRQRAAYRRGLARTATIATLIIAVVSGLAVSERIQARRADRQRREAEAQRTEARRNLYAAQMNLAQQAWEEGNLNRAQTLLEAWRPEPGQEDPRGYEWRFLWRLCQGASLFAFRGHPYRVTAVAFAPDGRTVASAGGDTVKLWDTRTKREVASLRGPADPLSVAFSPDGHFLAVGDWQGTVRLWSVASRQPITALRGHRGAVWSVTFSPDGRTLASAGDSIRLWDVASRHCLASLRGHRGLVRSVAFAPDGKLLATGGDDGTVRLWGVATRRLAASLSAHAFQIRSVAFAPDGRTLASASAAGTVQLWDVATRREVGTLQGHRLSVLSVAFSPRGKLLASGSEDSTVRVWDLTTRQEVATLRGHRASLSGAAVLSVAFSPDGKRLASGADDRTVRIWEPALRGDQDSLLRQTGLVAAVAVAPDGKTMATGSADGTVKLCDLSTGQARTTLHGHRGAVRRIGFSANGRLLFTGSDDQTARVWAVGSQRELATVRGMTRAPYAAALSPDGRTLAVGSEDTTARLFDVASRRVVATLRGHTGWVIGVAFSPDGRLLASVCPAGPVKLWEVASRRELASLRNETVTGLLLFSPDGKSLVTGGIEGRLKLWDLAGRRLVATLSGRAGAATDAVISPDGKTLAVASADVIALWNLTAQQEVAVLRGHEGPISSLAFAPDGNTLVSGSSDGTVRFWRAASFRETDPLRLSFARVGDRSIVLQWQPLPGVAGYNVYRRVAGSGGSKLEQVNPLPLTGTAYTDRVAGEIRHRSLAYEVAPVFPATGNQTVEGPRASVRAELAAPGWLGSSIDEGARSGSVEFSPVSRQILIRGSGGDIWGDADQCYLLSQPVEGDFQITVRMLTKPVQTNEYAKAGLMVRESLAPGARNAYLFTMAAQGLRFQSRSTTDDLTDNQTVLPNAVVRLPVTLRLTRRGNTITSEYSQDDGRSFHPAGDPVQFRPGLAKTLYVGLGITSHRPGRISQARFSDLEIRQR